MAAARGNQPAQEAWRFRRAVARVEPSLTPLLVEHATGYWQRPLARLEVGNERVVWTIDREIVLEFRFSLNGPSQLVVHDFSLYEPVRGAIRSRHVGIKVRNVDLEAYLGGRALGPAHAQRGNSRPVHSIRCNGQRGDLVAIQTQCKG